MLQNYLQHLYLIHKTILYQFILNKIWIIETFLMCKETKSFILGVWYGRTHRALGGGLNPWITASRGRSQVMKRSTLALQPEADKHHPNCPTNGLMSTKYSKHSHCTGPGTMGLYYTLNCTHYTGNGTRDQWVTYPFHRSRSRVVSMSHYSAFMEWVSRFLPFQHLLKLLIIARLNLEWSQIFLRPWDSYCYQLFQRNYVI